MISEKLQINYGDKILQFSVMRRDRATLAISVTPDLEIEVSAPHDASTERILEKIRKRAPWILRQIKYFSQFHPRTPERQFVAGETHLYLGRRYKLKVVPHIQQQVKLNGGCLIVQSHRPKDNRYTQKLVENWYADRAKVKFRERLVLCQQLFPRPDEYQPASLIVRELRQRWGSMTPNRNLVLNLTLIRSSVDAIDYVITHELCHIRHDHHGAEFYKLLDRVMPDWKKCKSKLERQLA